MDPLEADDDVVSILLVSEENEHHAFTILARAVQPPATGASSVGDGNGTPITPPPTLVLLGV